MLMLATLTGGLAYNRQLAVTSAAREGVRYAATLPQPVTMTQTTWADKVHSVTVNSSDGELEPGTAGRYVCVARIANFVMFKREYDQAGSGVTTANATCFDDGRDATENRVQVIASRESTFEAMVFSHDLNLRSRGVARYESPAPTP